MPFLDKQGLAYLWDRITANIRKEIKNIPTITPDTIVELMNETGAAQPIADVDNSVLTTEDNKILIL